MRLIWRINLNSFKKEKLLFIFKILLEWKSGKIEWKHFQMEETDKEEVHNFICHSQVAKKNVENFIALFAI